MAVRGTSSRKRTPVQPTDNVTLTTLPARIRATGSVTSGNITIGYSAPDRAEQDSETCEQVGD